MALVEVPDVGLDGESAQGPHAAHAEDQLLVQPHLPAADVEDVGDRPVRGVVDGVIRVEQEHGDATDLDGPYVDMDGPLRQLDRDGQRVALAPERARERHPDEVVVGVAVLLVAVSVDRLAEVAVAVQQADPDERQRHVAGGLHVVAREDAQAARVDAHRFVEPVLGTEVGDRALELAGVAPMEPVVGAVGHVAVEVGDDALGLDHEVGVVEQARPVDHARQDRDRAVRPRPDAAVDAPEHPAGRRVPGPIEVVGETPQSLQLRWHTDVARRRRGNADGGLHLRG